MNVSTTGVWIGMGHSGFLDTPTVSSRERTCGGLESFGRTVEDDKRPSGEVAQDVMKHSDETPAMVASPERAWGVLFARVVLGLMFFQGAWWRVFELGPVEHARRFFVEPYAGSFLPDWGLWAAGTAVPFAELVGGFLVLLGLWQPLGLILLGAVLVLVTFGHLVAEPIFAFNAHVMPRLVLLVFLLVAPPSWDRFSVDGLLEGRGPEP